MMWSSIAATVVDPFPGARALQPQRAHFRRRRVAIEARHEHSDTAEHLSKEYRLGVINHGMLYKDIQSWMARKFGNPDPHMKIGLEHFSDQLDRFWALKDLNFEIERASE